MPEKQSDLTKAISKGLQSDAPKTAKGKAKADTDAVKTEASIMADPVQVNKLNQERWWQSGVGFFGTGGVLWSIGAIVTQIATHGADLASYDVGMMTTAVGSLGAFVMVLYRRFWPDLRPLFWRWGE